MKDRSHSSLVALREMTALLNRAGGTLEQVKRLLPLMSATNRDVEREGAENRFRLVLFYRFNTGEITRGKV